MKSSVCLLKLALRHRIKNWYIHQQSFTLEYVSKRYSSKTLIKLIWILTRQVSKYLTLIGMTLKVTLKHEAGVKVPNQHAL